MNQATKNRANKMAVTLGMPQGTAANRLRKMLLFRQLKKHNENVCVRCSNIIETVHELSVEHIKPWYSAESFFDLENVAFSHMFCNRPHTNHGGTPKRILAPEGQAWCSLCKSFKILEAFANHSTRWNGVDTECRDCKNERNALRDRRKV